MTIFLPILDYANDIHDKGITLTKDLSRVENAKEFPAYSGPYRPTKSHNANEPHIHIFIDYLERKKMS